MLRRIAMLSAHTSPLEQPGDGDAGGALGVDPVSAGDADDWRRMFEVNVIGTLLVTQALLPALVRQTDRDPFVGACRQVHAGALLHGFVTLEEAGAFALPIPIDGSYSRAVDHLIDAHRR